MKRAMETCRLAARLGFLLSGFASVTSAAPDTWSSGGPFGGLSLSRFTFWGSPSTIYALSGREGIFKSTDDGRTWSSSNVGLERRDVRSLCVEAEVLVAGTDNGAFRSTDGGASWEPGLGIEGRFVEALAAEGSSPGLVFAGTDEGVFVSRDSGRVWSPQGLGDRTVTSVAVDGRRPGTLFAGARPGLFTSTDSGSTWRSIAPAFAAVDIATLLFETTSGALYFTTREGILARTVDSGETIRSLPNPPVAAVGVDPSHPSRLYAAVGYALRRSVDSGDTWEQIRTGDGIVDVAVDPRSPSDLFLTTSDGPEKSTDSGDHWVPATKGITHRSISIVVADPRAPAVVYAAGAQGFYRSFDAGMTWELGNRGLPAHPSSRSLVADPRTPGRLFLTTYPDGVYRSTDFGASWLLSSRGLRPGFSVLTLAIDPFAPNVLYAGLDGDGVYKSTDSGDSWKGNSFASLGATSVSLLLTDPLVPDTVYAGTILGVGKSTDGGRTWSYLEGGPADLAANALAVDASAPSPTLYAATNHGVFKSTDGRRWVPGVRLPNLGLTSLALHPSRPGTLYVGGSGIFRSTDGGETWSMASDGLPESPVSSLAFAADGSNLHAGLASRSVWEASLPSARTTLLVPASVRAPGAGGAFYTTDLTVANEGEESARFVLSFAAHDRDGRRGPEREFSLAPGASRTFPDVLGSVFGETETFGALWITSSSGSLQALAETKTPAFGGTVGQAVPAARFEDLIGASGRSILGIREDALFRTNLVIANATDEPLVVVASLSSESGSALGSARFFALPPRGMTQVARIVRVFGETSEVSGGRLDLFASGGGRFAAYAALIDNATNDPRTLLPTSFPLSDPVSSDVWILPSSAHAMGLGGSLFTTDLTVANLESFTARFKVELSGSAGAGTTFDLGAQKSVTYRDVVANVLATPSGFGALRITSQYSTGKIRRLELAAQTSTPGFGGTLGQSVPIVTLREAQRKGEERSILAIRQSADFRTNLVLANATEVPVDVDVRLIAESGDRLATKRYALAPLAMIQVNAVVRDLGVDGDVSGARLALSTPTENGAFAAYASAIDNVTNDPRTLPAR